MDKGEQREEDSRKRAQHEQRDGGHLCMSVQRMISK